jgi:hypothetical protein
MARELTPIIVAAWSVVTMRTCPAHVGHQLVTTLSGCEMTYCSIISTVISFLLLIRKSLKVLPIRRYPFLPRLVYVSDLGSEQQEVVSTV